MRVLSHDFLYRNQSDWAALEDLNARIRKSGFRVLSEEDLRTYPKLYRKVCGDLAEARLKQLSPDLMAYLNQIVAAAHQNLYSNKRSVRSNIARLLKNLKNRFLARILPGTIRRTRWFLLVAAFLFFGSYLLSALLVLQDRSRASVVVPEDVLVMMEESFSVSPDDVRSADAASAMFAYYVQHNVSIAFISFATGILLGLGTLFFVVYNGLLLGSVTGYVISSGYGWNFLSFVTAHSVFELSGLVVAAAAGFLLGFTLIAPGNVSRREALRQVKTDLLTLVGVAAVLISSAAVLEGFLSPQPLPYAVKAVAAGICFSLEAAYLVYCTVVNWRRRRV